MNLFKVISVIMALAALCVTVSMVYLVVMLFPNSDAFDVLMFLAMGAVCVGLLGFAIMVIVTAWELE